MVQWSIDSYMHSFGKGQVAEEEEEEEDQIVRVIWHLMNTQCQKGRVIMSECIPYLDNASC